MARQQGGHAQVAMAFETTYGLAATSGFTRMPFASTTLGAAQPLLASELLGYGRDPIDPQRDAITVDGNMSVPIDPTFFGFWLKAALGSPVSTPEAGKHSHLFASGAVVLPSMTVEVQHPQVPAFALNTGVMVNTLSWTMQRSGLLTASLALIGRDEVVGPATSAGTPAELAVERFGHFNGTVTRNGAVLGNVVSMEVTYTNNLDPVEVIGQGGLIGGLDPAMAALTGRTTIRFDNTVLLQQAQNGETCAFEFGYVRPDGQSVLFSLPTVHLPRAKAQVDGPAGVQVQFDWQAAQTASGDPMLLVTLVNGKAAY